MKKDQIENWILQRISMCKDDIIDAYTEITHGRRREDKKMLQAIINHNQGCVQAYCTVLSYLEEDKENEMV